jgi:hypothetical protein
MRYVLVGRASVVGLALLLFLSFCSVSSGAEQVIAAKVTTLIGAVNVTKADGTTETLKDTSKPIVLPATIEMAGAKGSFWISLPSALAGKFNSVSWTMRQGETVQVSLLKTNRGVRFEYPKGTRKFFLDANNRENVLVVRAIAKTTSVVILQNKVIVPEKDSAILTCPLNTFASVTVLPGQVSEVEFNYSPKDEFIQVVGVVSQLGTVIPGPIEKPIGIPPVERLAIPVPAPEPIEQSPSQP